MLRLLPFRRLLTAQSPAAWAFRRPLHVGPVKTPVFARFCGVPSLKTAGLAQIRFNSTSTPPKTTKRATSDFAKLIRLARPEFGTMAGALVCLVVTSTVTMLLPLVIGRIIDNARHLEGQAAEQSSQSVGEITIFGLPEDMFYLSIVGVFAIGAIANFGRIYLLKLTGEKLVARIRSRLFAKILSQDSYFFDVGPSKNGMNVGDLISRISSDTQIISKSLSANISDGARAVISGFVGLTMMWIVSWKLCMCMSLMFPPLIVMSMVYGRRIKQLSRTIQENLGALTKITEEKLNGLKTIQSFARQNLVIHDYNKEIRQLFNTSMREGKLSGIYYGGNGLLGNLMIIGLLYVGTRLISLGEITLGDLSSFMMYAAYTGGSVFGLGNFYTELMKGIGAAERVFELTESHPRITTTLGKKVKDLNGDIRFENINFRYPSRPDVQVLGKTPFNLTIKKGEHVCIVGPSGSGKSTVSQLLLRFYDPISGSIFVNNHNIRDLNLNFYRSQLGYVQQEPLLFAGTIRENITFGKDNCTEEEIENATKLSNAYHFIQAFPRGLDTVIGPSSSGSAQLSGGQRQRISLARTLIKKPSIMILDEATAALDSIAEEVVMKNLQQLTKQYPITMIAIAHRLSTIKNSERIVVLNSEGAIVEDGAFSQLYENEDSQFNRLLKQHEVE